MKTWLKGISMWYRHCPSFVPSNSLVHTNSTWL
jgi:hypothetical protein